MTENAAAPAVPPAPDVTAERRGNALIATVDAKVLDDKVLALLSTVLDGAASDRSISIVVVNMAHVQVVPSLGLGLLLRISQKCGSRSQRFVLAALTLRVRQTVILTQLDRILKFADSVDAAIAG